MQGFLARNLEKTTSKDKKKIGETIISWRAPETAPVERGITWQISAVIVAVLLILWGIWQKTVSFSILIFLISGIYFYYHREKPKIIRISLTTRGILVGNLFFPFADIAGFWIFYAPPEISTLNFAVKKGILREVSLQIADQNPDEIRGFLELHLPEFLERKEKISEKIIRIFKL